MNFDVEKVERWIGAEFYFTVVRDDGGKGEIQLNMKLLVEEYEDCIVWEASE